MSTKRPPSQEPTPIVLQPRSAGQQAASQHLVLPPAFLARYEIGEVLGEGGCGKAYRAMDRELSRPVAIKILMRHTDRALVQRFMQEGRLMARITDPNVVTIYDLDLVDGHPCLVMELVEGGNLRARLAHWNPGDTPDPGRPTVEESLLLIAATLSGLEACHAIGVVHRDLKPENLLLTHEGGVKIADLGVARYADALSDLTKTGDLLGTPRYMAPEQIQGVEASVASDIHGIGTILFEMLSGERAYAAQTLPQLFVLLASPTVPDLRTVAPHVPEQVAALVRRAMSKDPTGRPASARDMLAEVRDLLGEIDPALASAAQLQRPAPATGPTVQLAARPSSPPPRVLNRASTSSSEMATAQVPVMGDPRSRIALGLTLATAALIGVLLAVKPWPRPVPLPALPPSASTSAAPAPDLSAWQDPALWNLHAELQQIAFLQRFRRDEWSTLHTYITPGTWDMNQAVKVVTSLQTASAKDARSLSTAMAVLRGLPASAHGGPLERVQLTRLRGLQFVSSFIRERLDHYMSELPKDDVLDPERMERVDRYQFSESVRSQLVQFAADFPLALKEAVAARDESRDAVGVLLQDLARVSEWQYSAGRGAQSSPEIVAAVASLRRGLAAPHPDEATRRALSVAETTWLWGEVGAGTKTARTALKFACSQLEALERDLPRARLALEAHRMTLSQTLARYEK